MVGSKTWQDVGGKPGLDMPRDKKATNYGKDLINDRRASARLILAPKNLGTN